MSHVPDFIRRAAMLLLLLTLPEDVIARALAPQGSQSTGQSEADRVQSTIRGQMRDAVRLPPFQGDWNSLILLRLSDVFRQGGGLDSYQDLYVAGVGRRGLAVGYLTAADALVKTGDIAGARQYMDKGIRIQISSEELFEAANQVFATRVVLGSAVLDGVYKEARGLALLTGTLACSYPCYEVIDYALLLSNFAVDSHLRSREEAERNALRDVMVKAVLRGSGLGKAVRTTATHLVGQPDSVHVMVDRVLNSPEYRSEIMQAVGRLSIYASARATGLAASELADRLLTAQRLLNQGAASAGLAAVASSRQARSMTGTWDFGSWGALELTQTGASVHGLQRGSNFTRLVQGVVSESGEIMLTIVDDCPIQLTGQADPSFTRVPIRMKGEACGYAAEYTLVRRSPSAPSGIGPAGPEDDRCQDQSDFGMPADTTSPWEKPGNPNDPGDRKTHFSTFVNLRPDCWTGWINVLGGRAWYVTGRGIPSGSVEIEFGEDGFRAVVPPHEAVGFGNGLGWHGEAFRLRGAEGAAEIVVDHSSEADQAAELSRQRQSLRHSTTNGYPMCSADDPVVLSPATTREVQLPVKPGCTTPWVLIAGFNLFGIDSTVPVLALFDAGRHPMMWNMNAAWGVAWTVPFCLRSTGGEGTATIRIGH